MSPSCACLVHRYVYPSIFTTRSNLVCVMSWSESIKGKKGTWFLVGYFYLFFSLWLFFFVGIFACAVLVMRGVGSLSYWEKHWVNIRECALLQSIVIKSDLGIFMSQPKRIKKKLKVLIFYMKKLRKKNLYEYRLYML